MKKRMLITTESLTIGGVETSLLSFIKTLKKYYEIDLYVLKGGNLKKEFEKEVKVNYIKMPNIKSKLIFRIYKNLFFKTLTKKFKNSKKYDISIAYYGINNFCDSFALAANARKHFIWVHNNFETAYKLSPLKLILKVRNRIIKKKFIQFDKIISVSESAKQGFINIMNIPKERIEVINNLIDVEKINKNATEECELNINGENNLIYVGRLTKSKKVDSLLYEFIKIKKDIIDAKLYLIGDGEELNNLKVIVESNNIEDVYFLGFQNNPYKYIKKCNLVVTASESEAYGMNLVEALVLKKYFVSSDNEGAIEIFNKLNKKNKNNGIICKENLIHKNCINYLKNQEKINPNFNMENANEEILKQFLEIFK